MINISDGDSSDGDPIPYADALKQRETEDGNVLMFNCHLSATAADPFRFPSNGEVLPDELARVLFKMSSILPETIYKCSSRRVRPYTQCARYGIQCRHGGTHQILGYGDTGGRARQLTLKRRTRW